MLQDTAEGSMWGNAYLDHCSDLYAIASDSRRLRRAVIALDARVNAVVEQMTCPQAMPPYFYELGEDYRRQFSYDSHDE